MLIAWRTIKSSVSANTMMVITDVEHLRAFLAEVAATPNGTVGPVELRIEHRLTAFVLEIVGSNLTNDPAVDGLALNFRDISERKALEEKLRQLAFHDPADAAGEPKFVP